MDRSDSMQNLFKKYLNNECSPEEVKEFLAYFNNPDYEPQLRRMINETLDNIDADDDGSRWSDATDESFAIIKKDLVAERSKLVPIYRRTWVRIAVAAILLVGAFTVYNLLTKVAQKPEIVKTKISNPDAKNNKASLTLADGSSIILENVEDGVIAQQGSAKILKTTNGELTYKLLTENPSEVLLNTITTPRGGKYQLILAEGTKI